MNTQPISQELRAYLMEQQALQQAANLPALYQQPPAPAPVVYPVSRMFPELAQPVQQTVVVQRFDVKAQRMAALALLLLCGGGGVDLAGHGIKAAGTGMWALAAIFVAGAVSRILSPKRNHAGGVHLEVHGNHNRIRL